MSEERPRSAHVRQTTAAWIIRLSVAGLLWSAIATLTGYRARPTAIDLFFSVLNLPVARTPLSVVVMAVLTVTLLRRRRAGLWILAVGQVVGLYIGLRVALHQTLPQAFEIWVVRRDAPAALAAMPVAVVALAVLWWVRPLFPARLQRGSWIPAGWTLLTGVLASGIIGWGLLRLAGRAHTTVVDVVRLLLAASGLVSRPLRLVGPLWVIDVVAVLLALSAITALLTFLRTATSAGDWTPESELRIRRLVRVHGEEDSLSYLATRHDRAAVFSTDGNAFVSYGIRRGVALAAGDPIGQRGSWSDAIDRWTAEVRRYGWIPAVISVGREGAKEYARHGFTVMEMGDEAILRTDTFQLSAPAMAPVRKAVNHARKEGVTVKIARLRQLCEEERREVEHLAELWRHGEERGFSMALDRLADPSDSETVVVRAFRDDRCVGLLTFIPWGLRGCSLNLMRRSPEAPHGTVELMVAELMAQGSAFGLTRASLNFCMFRKVFESSEEVAAAPIRRLNRRVLSVMDRFWQLNRLYQNNKRYLPQWQDRYIAYGDQASLPRVLIAMAAAEGFLPQLGAPHPARVLNAEQLAEAQAINRMAVVSAAELAPRLNDQQRVRREHLQNLIDAGLGGYPAFHSRPTHTLAELLAATPGTTARISARVRRVRDHGGVVFLDLVDGRDRVQVVAERSGVAGSTRRLATLVDSGDVLLVEGTWGMSGNGTPSLLMTSWEVAAKALHALPWQGWNDPDARARNRSADLLVHPEQAEYLRIRSAVVASLRRSLSEDGYLEVETPVLHPIHGGATARPFVTHINAYNRDLYLRIAPELYLKRLVVGGMGAVFEISRNFRNEGVDTTHNPEFSALEAYRPYADYDDMRHLTERMVRDAARAVHGEERLLVKGEWIDISGPWPVVSVLDAVSTAVGEVIDMNTPLEELTRLADKHQIAVTETMGVGAIIEELYGDLVEPATLAPTFYIDFPQETSPLTRKHRSKPGLVERWDLVVGGMELGTAYSELTDPLDQRVRFTDQSLKAAAGDVEAMQLDEDFLTALETGMPPTGGLGIGVDRLVMLLTQQPIRSVLAFPYAAPTKTQLRNRA